MSADESAARYARLVTAQRLRRERGEFITKADLDKIVTLWLQPDQLALWGIPYAMREGCQQTPYDLWRAAHEYRAPSPLADACYAFEVEPSKWRATEAGKRFVEARRDEARAAMAEAANG